MKWRAGLYAVCPLCHAKRIRGETLSSYDFLEHNPDLPKRTYTLPARRHRYECGCVMIESEKNHLIRVTAVSTNHYLVITETCPGALVMISKALTYIASRHDLSTLSTYESNELMAEKAANITAYAIHYALRNSCVLQDNYRLPPIPLLDCHVKLLAKTFGKV